MITEDEGLKGKMIRHSSVHNRKLKPYLTYIWHVGEDLGNLIFCVTLDSPFFQECALKKPTILIMWQQGWQHPTQIYTMHISALGQEDRKGRSESGYCKISLQRSTIATTHARCVSREREKERWWGGKEYEAAPFCLQRNLTAGGHVGRVWCSGNSERVRK